MTSEKVLVVGPNGAAAVYNSIRATSRVLSGDGSDALRRTIARRLDTGGGFVGNAWVQSTTLESIHRPQ
jgi:hypothetical protein